MPNSLRSKLYGSCRWMTGERMASSYQRIESYTSPYRTKGIATRARRREPSLHNESPRKSPMAMKCSGPGPPSAVTRAKYAVQRTGTPTEKKRGARRSCSMRSRIDSNLIAPVPPAGGGLSAPAARPEAPPGAGPPARGDEIGRAHVELQSHVNLVCRL